MHVVSKWHLSVANYFEVRNIDVLLGSYHFPGVPGNHCTIVNAETRWACHHLNPVITSNDRNMFAKSLIAGDTACDVQFLEGDFESSQHVVKHSVKLAGNLNEGRKLNCCCQVDEGLHARELYRCPLELWLHHILTVNYLLCKGFESGKTHVSRVLLQGDREGVSLRVSKTG